MSTENAILGDVDARGRLIPQTDAQRKARSETLAHFLEEIAGITDEADTEETWTEVMRGIDESRPHRKLFEGID